MIKETFRNYLTMEMALSCEYARDHTPSTTMERKKVGDIIAIRYPLGAIGLKEAKGYLWLRVDGLEELDFLSLTESLEVSPDSDEPIFDKRRFCIPFHRLKKVYPAFDINRACDLDDIYQPFLILDQDNYRFLTSRKPFSVYGLIFDKKTGLYL